MDTDFSNQSMLDIFIYETSQNLEQLETLMLGGERASGFSPETVNDIFRVMHTIKGSSAMMMCDNIAALAHAMEDLFFYLREEKPARLNYGLLSDLVLEGVDFIKLEMGKVERAEALDGDPAPLAGRIRGFLAGVRGEAEAPETAAEPPPAEHYYLSPAAAGAAAKGYSITVFFEDGCEMENIRAFAIIHNLRDITEEFSHFPEDIIDNDDSVAVIREHGFKIILKTERSLSELYELLSHTAFIRDLEILELDAAEAATALGAPAAEAADAAAPASAGQRRVEQVQSENKAAHPGLISVDVLKLDRLMDLVGEMVISEAMVTQNPELQGLPLNSFHKAARQLRKITGEMQDLVMSVRMVPLAASFHKMHRVVRDMSRKLGKEIELNLIGENTEVDKKILEHISDPLMHLVRNAADHGIESPEARAAAGKPRMGRITLEAKTAGSDVLLFVRDDGGGIDREAVLRKAREQNLLPRPESEMTDREVYGLIFLPGFSTSSAITEFSGRGVGMDVVVKNLESIGGTIAVDSTAGAGTVTTLKIPLTLAIVDGMSVRVGRSKYTLPTTSIRETFRAKAHDLITDPEGGEMIMVRGQCHSVLRLHRLFDVQGAVEELTAGIMLVLEQDTRCVVLFADELLGQHQVVVKALPAYMRGLRRASTLAGCTLLGDGGISLILNVGGLMNLDTAGL